MITPQISKKYNTIEALRGAAAVAVVFYHVARHLNKFNGTTAFLTFFQFGHAGVDLFFVLSGFIIFHAHFKDIGRPERLRHYWWRRFTRVAPMYWIALLATVAMMMAGRHIPSISSLFLSLTLLPSHSEPLLGVAWTLQYEFLFYAIFCTIILNRMLGITLFAVWFCAIAVSSLAIGVQGILPPSIFGIYNIEFFLGIAASLLFRRGLVSAPRRLFALGCGLFLAAALAEDLGILNGYAQMARLIYGVPAMMIVAGAAGLDGGGAVRVPSVLQELGAGSYSIYLFQFVFIGVAWQALQVLGVARVTMAGCFLILAAAGIVGGVMMRRYVEYPIMQWMRRESRPLPVLALPEADRSAG